jgi:glycosyltransferase involved in cell wall biosynthesis
VTNSATISPEISVVVATYNRSDILRGTLQSLSEQDCPASEYEVIVVDNNSTDDTATIIESLRDTSGYEHFLFCFESRQGVSHARNSGISRARGRVIAFTDDDIRPARNWVSSIREVFTKFADVDCIGGRVLPEAETKFPPWLTREYWTPLALLDLGDAPLMLDVRTGPGLVAANLAVRSAAFRDVGMFRSELQRVKGSIGSLEDHEFQLRLSAANKRLMYFPEIVVYAHVLEERLSKSYHRRWFYGHGLFYALMRDKEFEDTRIRVFDVPAHLYRRTFRNAFEWLRYRLTRRAELKFQQELDILFFLGFFRKRFADRRTILRFGSQGGHHIHHAPF